ncbi:plasminogen-like [Saccoglossus kowalevskii]
MESNFEKYGVDVVNTYSVKYDISSLMHYGSHYFSKNGHPTITPVNPLDMPKMGQRNYLSFYDVKLANMLYECNAQCADWLPECSGDGYIGPECTCVCHDGLVGRCEAPSECFTQSDGGDYRGAQNATSRGKSCQSWSDQRPYSHQFTPENFPNTGLGAHNYCRNPDRDIRPWCITTDSVISWDYCDVGLPSDKCDFRECYVKPDGLDYRGTVDTTVGGILCQKWSEQTPHTHEFSQVNYPNGGLGRHNYCRNPDYDGAPWCFTTNPDIRWQHCDVGRPTENCGLTECYEHENANDYRGVVSVTQTGYDCQDWTDVTSVSLNYDPENYPNAGLGDHNFCRNPDDKQQPWCFSTNPSIQWEYCDVDSYSDSCGYTECYVNEDASDYRGTVNATGDYQCMNWTEELPDNLGYNTQNFPLYDLDNHNYCRNPDGDSHAWCFTTDPKVEWVYCDVGISNFICD